MAVTTGKTAEVMLESAMEAYESQQDLLSLVLTDKPNPAMLQNAGNWMWKPVQ